MRNIGLVFGVLSCLVCSNVTIAKEANFESTAGVCFKIDSAYSKEISNMIDAVRLKIRQAQESGQFVAYLSVPISPRGGGNFDINTEIAAKISESVSARFGEKLWVLDPAAYDLPKVGDKSAGGGEYMAVWSDVLAGKDGSGKDFDLIYFSGPNDYLDFFGADNIDLIGDVETWVNTRELNDPKFESFINTEENRRKFLKYYSLRAGVSYSKGAHDEWNILHNLNEKSRIGDDIAIFYNGQAVETGDLYDTVDKGYEVACQ